MPAAQVFSIANLFALTGWAIIVLAIVLRRPWWRDAVAGVLWPSLMSVLYISALAIGWGAAEGSFASLGEVRALFASDWMLLAGWVHYLAFDLFIGAWIAAAAERAKLSRLCLHATQGLPLVGWLAQRSSSGREWVIAVALVWAGLSAAVFLQAWHGKPPLPF